MKSLHISFPLGQVFFRSITLLTLFCTTIELFARTTNGRRFFHYESYGSSHPHFDTQIIRSKDRVSQDGHIDCMFLGDSQILHGIDPTAVEQAYFQKTGKSITCQNFGLGGLKPITAGALVKLLIRNFHPSIIIYGTDLFDYTEVLIDSDASIMSSPWVQYQLGFFSVDGWLIEKSNSYRYYLGIDRYFPAEDENVAYIEPNGHSIKFSNKTGMSDKEQLEYFNNLLDKPKITEEELNGLRGILSINDEVKIIVLETPVNPIFFQNNHFSYSRKVYPDFRNILENETTWAGSELWLTQEDLQIPTDGWYDFLHLNQKGSIYFSRTVGELLGATTFPIVKNTP